MSRRALVASAGFLALVALVALLAPVLPLRDPLAQPDGLVLRELSPLSRPQAILKADGSLQYAYNAQVAVSEDGVIVATGMTDSPLDVQQLVPMVEAITQTTKRKPGVVVADTGYLSESNLKQLRKKRQRCLVAVRGRKPRSWPHGRQTQRMHRILRLPWAKKIYDHRKTQGERPFAEIKQTMRFRRFSLRGRANIRGEWDLVCAAANLLHLHRAQRA